MRVAAGEVSDSSHGTSAKNTPVEAISENVCRPLSTLLIVRGSIAVIKPQIRVMPHIVFRAGLPDHESLLRCCLVGWTRLVHRFEEIA